MDLAYSTALGAHTWWDMQPDLSHERFEINGMRLADDPVSIATQRPTSDGPNQSFLVRQTRHQVWHKIRKMDCHSTHTTYNKLLSSTEKTRTHFIGQINNSQKFSLFQPTRKNKALHTKSLFSTTANCKTGRSSSAVVASSILERRNWFIW